MTLAKLSLKKMGWLPNAWWKLLFLTTFIFPSPCFSAAEPPGWEGLGLYGGQIYTLAIDPSNPNTLFAGSYYGDGLFKSTDGGETWQSVEGFRNSLVYSISFDPQNHLTIWVVTFWFIYKTEDGGRTWKLFDPAVTLEYYYYYYYYSLVIHPDNSNIIYVGTSGPDGSDDNAKIFKTIDGGVTWQETSLIADHNVWDLALNPQNPQEIWAVTGPSVVTQGSIYRSQDGGVTWITINTGLGDDWFWSIEINPQDPEVVFVTGGKGLYRTTDRGLTWSRFPSDNMACRTVALDPQNPNTVYANWGNHFSKSTDGGNNWDTAHSIYPLQFLCLKVHPQNPQVLFGGEANLGIYKSIDGGEHWEPINQGIRANHVYDSAISPRGKILVGSLSGVYLMAERGRWEQINLRPTRVVTFKPGNDSIIFAGFEEAFGKSIDSGENWSLVYLSSSHNRVSSIALTPQKPETLYLGVYYWSGTKGEIYKSTDSGETFHLLHSFDVPVNTVKVSPKNPKVIYAGTGMFYAPIKPGGVYRSTDGGKSWEEIKNGIVVNTLALDPQNPEVIYAGCGASNGLYAGFFGSTDGGASWEEKDFGIPEGAAIVDLGIDSNNNNTLYAATSRHGIYISYDAGNYWTRLGLSDYWLFDVLVGASSPTASKKITPGKTSLPSSNLYAGSGSGILEFTGGGIGIVAGMITNTETGSGITGATVSTDTGGVALSLSGSYIMVAPAGYCTVTGYTEGYGFESRSGVLITDGNETTADLSLKPLAKVNIKNIELETNGAIQVNQPITLKVEVESASTPYYQYWVASGYGTSAYGNWTLLKSYTTENTLTWSPLTQDHYVLVVWVTDDISLHAPQMGGLSAAVGQGTELQIKSISSDITASSTFSTPINLLTTTFGNSISYYQYWVTSSYGCPPTVQSWEAIGNYSIDNRGAWTPTEGGHYVLVVHVSDDPETSIPEIAGMTCTIGE